jgi:hypothetical protein
LKNGSTVPLSVTVSGCRGDRALLPTVARIHPSENAVLLNVRAFHAVEADADIPGEQLLVVIRA